MSALFLFGIDSVLGQQLQPLVKSPPTTAAPPLKTPDASSKLEGYPLQDQSTVVGDRVSGNNAAAYSQSNGSAQNGLTPLKPMQPLSMAVGEAKKFELENEQTDPESEFVQAVFLLPGPKKGSFKQTDTLNGTNGIPQAESLGATTPPKNESLLAGEAELNKAIQEGGNGYFDSLQREDFFQTAVEPYRIYRASEATLSYMPRSSRNLGWTSLEWEPFLKRSQSNGLTGSIQHHFLNGPLTIDLPPRLHDLMIGYQHRGQIGERFSFDCAAAVGVFSDFNGSVREGIRFPAHAVGIFHASHRADFVLGIDHLDRDDYAILPVIGISWHDLNFTALRYDLVFPRPRIDFTINDGERLYLAGRLGGGTWDIEYPSGDGDVMNYRDFRLLIGKEKRYLDGSRHAVELGFVFDRKLSLRESSDELDFSNSLILRFISSH